MNKLNISTILLLLFFSCQKATISPKDYPYVVMEEVSVLPDGVRFIATLVDQGTEPIVSHGFVWGGTNEPNIEEDNTIYLAGDSSLEPFEVEVFNGLVKDKMYVVRPFVNASNVLVYGAESSFISAGSRHPKIIDVSPKYGPPGALIELIGENFGYGISSNTVIFGEIEAQIDSASSSKLYVIVPEIQESGLVSISLSTSEMTTTASDKFDVYFPWTKISGTHNSRWSSPSFSIDNNVYIIISESGGGIKYNIIEKQWTGFLLPEASGRYPMAFTARGKGYVLLENNFWEFDTNSGSWTQRASFPGNVISNRYTFTLSFDKIGIIGFCFRSQSVWAYDPTLDKWQRKADFPVNFNSPNYQSVWGNYSFSLGNQGYIGINYTGSGFWMYDVNSDSWHTKKAMPADSYDNLASLVINGEAFVGLGRNHTWSDGYVAKEMWKYDHVNDNWEQYQSSPTGFCVYSSFAIGDKGMILSGYSSTSDDGEIWEFDPKKN